MYVVAGRIDRMDQLHIICDDMILGGGRTNDGYDSVIL